MKKLANIVKNLIEEVKNTKSNPDEMELIANYLRTECI